MRALTKNKDVDAKIIGSLNDYELEKVCQVNKYVNSICNDEKFWINRLLSKFGKYLGSLYDIKKRNSTIDNWQEYYKFLISSLIDYVGNDENLNILYDARIENSKKISEMGSIEEIDKFLNEEELVDSEVAFQHPEYLEYFIERSKNDYRFFPLWVKGVFGRFTDFVECYIKYPEKLRLILNDPRAKPNAILDLLDGEIFLETLKDPRLNLDGVANALYRANKEKLKYLIPLYEKLGGNPDIYKYIFQKLRINISNKVYRSLLMDL